jgi:hypothetical protein
VLSSYPQGTVGIGLLVLRNTLAVIILGVALEHNGLSLPVAATIVAASALTCGAVATHLVPGAHMSYAIATAISFSVALLGPGARGQSLTDSLRPRADTCTAATWTNVSTSRLRFKSNNLGRIFAKGLSALEKWRSLETIGAGRCHAIQPCFACHTPQKAQD